MTHWARCLLILLLRTLLVLVAYGDDRHLIFKASIVRERRAVLRAWGRFVCLNRGLCHLRLALLAFAASMLALR